MVLSNKQLKGGCLGIQLFLRILVMLVNIYEDQVIIFSSQSFYFNVIHINS